MRPILLFSAFISCFIAFTSAELIDGSKVVGNTSPASAVAFVCGKPAMYLTQSGWQRDDEQGCAMTDDEILDYCKERYPNLEIVNFVPSQSLVTINSWCNIGETSSCGNSSQLLLPDMDPESYEDSSDEFFTMNSTDMQQVLHKTVFTVRPFRCLVGPFQPDALLIPERCKFAHIDTFESANCSTFESWNTTAAKMCASTNMTLYSLAMLLPCSEPAKFGGVEYVCCQTAPVSDTPDLQVPTEVEADADLQDLNADDLAVTVTGDEVANENGGSDEEEESDEDCSNDVDYYRLYVTNPAALGKSEHERYEKARRCVITYYSERKATLVRDYMDTRFNITDSAKRLQVDQTFRKLYDEADKMWISVRRDMNDLHQRRVQEELRAKTNAAYDELQATLEEAADNDPHADVDQVSHIVTVAKSYISSLRREEQHWLGRYRFLEEHHPERLAEAHEQIKRYLMEINHRLNRTDDLLSRIPEFEKAVRERITRFIKENSDIDNEMKTLFPEGLVRANTQDTLSLSTTQAPNNPEFSTQTYSNIESELLETTVDYDADDVDDLDASNVAASVESVDLTSLDSASHIDDDAHPADRSSDEQSAESDRLKDYMIDVEDTSITDDSSEHIQPSALVIKSDAETDVARETNAAISDEDWSLVIFLCALLVGGLLITGTVIGFLIRRRTYALNALHIRTQTNVIDSDSRRLLETETERGILGNMQVNGYENPTYILYDKSAQQ